MNLMATMILAASLGSVSGLAMDPPMRQPEASATPEPLCLPPRHPERSPDPGLLLTQAAPAPCPSGQAMPPMAPARLAEASPAAGTTGPAGSCPPLPELAPRPAAPWVRGQRVTFQLFRYHNVSGEPHTISLEGDPGSLPAEAVIKWHLGPGAPTITMDLLGGGHDLAVPPGQRVSVMVEECESARYFVVRDGAQVVIDPDFLVVPQDRSR
jgi:hypothetical protein